MDMPKIPTLTSKIQREDGRGMHVLLAMGLIVSVGMLVSCGRPEPPEQARYTIVSTCPLPGYAEDVQIFEGFAYIADGQAGLQIVDISDPESTFLAGEYLTGKSAQGIAIRDSLAFLVTASSNGLVVIDIHDPAACSLLGSDPGYTEYKVVAPPDTFFAYIAALDFFIIENCSIPQYPYYDQRVSTPGDARGIYVTNSLAFVACEQMGLYIYYAARPDSAVYLVGSIDTPSNAQNVYVVDDLAYVADGRGGLIIIDITDPAAPFITGVYDTPEYANNVEVHDDRAFVADGEGGVLVIDVTEPSDPALHGTIECSYASDVSVRDSLVYIADRDLGLIIAIEDNP